MICAKTAINLLVEMPEYVLPGRADTMRYRAVVGHAKGQIVVGVHTVAHIPELKKIKQIIEPPEKYKSEIQALMSERAKFKKINDALWRSRPMPPALDLNQPRIAAHQAHQNRYTDFNVEMDAWSKSQDSNWAKWRDVGTELDRVMKQVEQEPEIAEKIKSAKKEVMAQAGQRHRFVVMQPLETIETRYSPAQYRQRFSEFRHFFSTDYSDDHADMLASVSSNLKPGEKIIKVKGPKHSMFVVVNDHEEHKLRETIRTIQQMIQRRRLVNDMGGQAAANDFAAELKNKLDDDK